jgi:predicted MPP superfamily phosphohydrolase
MMPHPSSGSTPAAAPPDPLEDSLLHRLLVASNRVQTLPLWLLLAIVGFNVGVVAVATRLSWTHIALFLGMAAFNWWLLIQLRRTHRSFGPDRPSALALTIVFATLSAIAGLAGLDALVLLILLACITGLVFYATWVEPMRLGVTRQGLTTTHWQADAPPLRLLHIGDIHVEYLGRREQKLNRLVAELKPDLILFSGDFVNLSNTHDPQSQADIRAILSGWQAPLGVFCVPGTPLVEPLECVEAFTHDLPNLTLLKNTWARVPTPAGDLHLLGMVVTHEMSKDRATLQQMMAQAPAAGLKLLLFHPPDLAPEADAAGIDLYLCGHTHGGQIRLPLIGAIFSSSHLGQRFIMGRYQLPTGMTLYTARGVGLEGLGAPRARFLCPPEIVLWEISGSR